MKGQGTCLFYYFRNKIKKMCFSARASFGVSAALLAGGVAPVKSVRQANQIPFPSYFQPSSVVKAFYGCRSEMRHTLITEQHLPISF
jgi:hypothetical protein